MIRGIMVTREANGFYLLQDHLLGVVLPFDRARQLLALYHRVEAVHYHVRQRRDRHA
jgi:hypothetical protein